MTPLATCVTAYVEQLQAVELSTIDSTDLCCPICCEDFGIVHPDFAPDDSEELAAFSELPLQKHAPCNDPVRTVCGHMFGESCLKDSLDVNSLCPLCRYDINTNALQVQHEAVLTGKFLRLRERDAMMDWHEISPYICILHVVLFPRDFREQFTHFYEHKLNHVHSNDQHTSLKALQSQITTELGHHLADYIFKLPAENRLPAPETCNALCMDILSDALALQRDAALVDFVLDCVRCAFRSIAAQQLVFGARTQLLYELESKTSPLHQDPALVDRLARGTNDEYLDCKQLASTPFDAAAVFATTKQLNARMPRYWIQALAQKIFWNNTLRTRVSKAVFVRRVREQEVSLDGVLLGHTKACERLGLPTSSRGHKHAQGLAATWIERLTVGVGREAYESWCIDG